jgi:hypothetical protein
MQKPLCKQFNKPPKCAKLFSTPDSPQQIKGFPSVFDPEKKEEERVEEKQRTTMQ